MNRQPAKVGGNIPEVAGCLLAFLAIFFFLLPVTGLAVILVRGWANTPGWLRGLWAASVLLLGGALVYTVVGQTASTVQQKAITDSLGYLSAQYVSARLSGDQLAVTIRMRNQDTQAHELCPSLEAVMAIPARTAADKTVLFPTSWWNGEGQRFCFQVPAGGSAEGTIGIGGRIGYGAGDYSADEVRAENFGWQVIQACIYPLQVDGVLFNTVRAEWKWQPGQSCHYTDYFGQRWS